MKSRAIRALPLPARRQLKMLGEGIRLARIRRRIPTALMAERVLTTRATLAKVEAGDPTVSIGIYATALFVLGLHERLSSVADPGRDHVGLVLDEDHLPRRIRTSSRGGAVPKSPHS